MKINVFESRVCQLKIIQLMAQIFQKAVGKQEITIFESLQVQDSHLRNVSWQEYISFISQPLKLSEFTE